MPDPSSDVSTEFTVNGTTYHPTNRPIVAICVDGCGDEYLDVAISRGRMPRFVEMTNRGRRWMGRGALPSFTNVNNAAIATGQPPSVTGISGNFFLDPATGEEVMMNSSRYLRCPTIFASASQAGRKVAVITAKEKLLSILSAGLKGIAFSSEKAAEARMASHGIEDVEELVGAATPEIYSGEASLYVLRAGATLVERSMADFLYLSLTDYMQHKFAPEETESIDFYAAIDHEIGRLLDAGAVVAITADHGMNAKNQPDGTPNVVFVESRITERLGPGHRVICPITDPYVVHHGALGSLVMVHLGGSADATTVAPWLLRLDGITEVYDRDTAARKLELPADRIGDLVVMSAKDVALGRTPEHHDLSLLASGLRSHGGRYEELVPMAISESLTPEYVARSQGDSRNFQIFDFACNGVVR